MEPIHPSPTWASALRCACAPRCRSTTCVQRQWALRELHAASASWLATNKARVGGTRPVSPRHAMRRAIVLRTSALYGRVLRARHEAFAW